MRISSLLVSFIFTAFVVEVHSQETTSGLEKISPAVSKLTELVEEEQRAEVFQLADSILQNSSDFVEKGAALFYKAKTEIDLFQLELAHQSLDRALELFHAKKYELGLVMTYDQKGDLYYLKDVPKAAIASYSMAALYGERQKLYRVLLELNQKKAEIYFNIQKIDSSFLSLKAALRYAKFARDDDFSITLVNQLSTNYHAQGELDSAIFYFQQNLKLKENTDDPDGLISDLSAMGNLCKERGDYEEAQEFLMEALEIAESLEGGYSKMTIYSELGDIYADQSIWNVSEDYYLKAIKIARGKKSRFIEAGCLRKLGYIYEQQGQRNKSIDNYEFALDLYLGLKNRINTAEVMILLSKLYKGKDQFEKIQDLLIELLKTSDNNHDVITTLKMKMALAEVEIKLKNYSKGLSYALECKKAFEEMEDKKGMQDVALIMSAAYAKRGEFRKAYDNHLQYNELKDSLVSVEKAEAIKKYALLATTKKKDAEISGQKEMLQKQQLSLLKKNNQLLLLGGGLGIVGLLIVLTLFVYYKNKQINKQHIKVLEKEKESNRLKAIIEGEEKERKRFARELHDGLGAVLSTVKMQISSVGHHFPKVGNSNAYKKAEELIDGACKTVRDISHDLMPHVLEQQGLFVAIEDMCNNLSTYNDITFDVIFFGDEDRPSDIQRIALYRIIQELLKNIIKHAEASEVIVQLTIEEDEIILIVEDDGKGFDPALQQKGIGISNIKTRTDYLDGSLDIDSVRGKGSTFSINLPIHNNISNK